MASFLSPSRSQRGHVYWIIFQGSEAPQVEVAGGFYYQKGIPRLETQLAANSRRLWKVRAQNTVEKQLETNKGKALDKVVDWLLTGDISIQYQTHKYLLESTKNTTSSLQKDIALEGWGSHFLACQHPNGQWGNYYYQPKWTSTHYTLLDLRNLEISPSTPACQKIVTQLFADCMDTDGSLNLSKSKIPSDICVDGMVLNYSAYFCPKDERNCRLVDYVLLQQKADGGFTWYLDSSSGDPHTTICVLEGLSSFQTAFPEYRTSDMLNASMKAVGFLIGHKLFINDDKRFMKLSCPYRYHYSLLRALEYLARNRVEETDSIALGLEYLASKGKNRKWNLEYQYPGATHFEMEALHTPSRWVTLKAMCILKYYCT